MKKNYFFAVLFLTFAVYVNAQDMIVLINGNIIEAKVLEILSTEIRYRRFDNLNGSIHIIPKREVYSIRYENGVVEVINSPVNEESTRAISNYDPKKLYFSFSLEPSGFLAGGPSATGEFLKGRTISTVYLSFPSLALKSTAEGFGFGVGGSVNYLWKNNQLGGFYLGGLFEWNMFPYLATLTNPYAVYNPATDSYSSGDVTEKINAHNFVIALNAGYRFVTKSGIYFRTGASIGMTLSTIIPTKFYYKPDIATGYIWR